MDPNAILGWITAALPPPWGYVVPAVLIVGYQWLKARFPGLTAHLPHLVPVPGPAPPAPPPIPLVPGAGPRFPALQAILGRVFGPDAPPPEQVDPAYLRRLRAEIDRLTPAPPPAAAGGGP